MTEKSYPVCCLCLSDVHLRESDECSFNPGCCGQTFHMSCTLSLINSFKFTKPTCPYCRAYLKTDWSLNKSSSQTSFFSQCYNYIDDKWLDLRYFITRNETPFAFLMGGVYTFLFMFWVSSKSKS